MIRLNYERLQLGISQETLGISAHVDQSDIAHALVTVLDYFAEMERVAA